jgi:hypothetical protein
MAKKQNSKDLVVKAEMFPVMAQGAEKVMALIEANLGGETFSPLDLPRIKVPAGGTEVFTVPTVEGNLHPAELIGIIIKTRITKQMWRKAYGTGEIVPPDCVSEDGGVTGVGDPGGPCQSCPFNKWGSVKMIEGAPGDEDSKKKGCQEKRLIFTILEGQILPHVIVAPAMSLKPSKQYLIAMTSAGGLAHSVYTSFILEADTNPRGQEYSKILMKKYADVEDPKATAAYAQAIAKYLEMSAADLRQATDFRDEASEEAEEFDEQS